MTDRPDMDVEIEMRSVALSSNVMALGYDSDTRTLAVTFRGGGAYRYGGVPADAAALVLGAEACGQSVGQVVRKRIIAAKFIYAKADAPIR